jgi:hypothetical protein
MDRATLADVARGAPLSRSEVSLEFTGGAGI